MNNLVGFILAGGKSSRIKELTKDKPKFFLEINGKKLINYHLDNLSELGIKTTYIVTGFLKNLVKETIGNNYKGMKIIYIDNDEFETTGHSYGLFLGKDVFKENNILLIHADVFCDSRLYYGVIENNFDNVILIDENYSVLTGDELIVQGKDDLVLGMNYNRTENIQGEFVGISKFSKEFLIKFCSYMDEFFKKESKKFVYEVIIDKFLEDTKFKINYKKIQGKRWVNINYVEDYEIAKEIADELYRKI